MGGGAPVQLVEAIRRALVERAFFASVEAIRADPERRPSPRERTSGTVQGRRRQLTHPPGWGSCRRGERIGRPRPDERTPVSHSRLLARPLLAAIFVSSGVSTLRDPSYVAHATAAGATAELIEIQGDHFTLIDPATDAPIDAVRAIEQS